MYIFFGVYFQVFFFVMQYINNFVICRASSKSIGVPSFQPFFQLLSRFVLCFSLHFLDNQGWKTTRLPPCIHSLFVLPKLDAKQQRGPQLFHLSTLLFNFYSLSACLCSCMCFFQYGTRIESNWKLVMVIWSKHVLKDNIS